jgi:hypothetical protein
MSGTWCPLPWMSLNVRNNGDVRVCCNANTSVNVAEVNSNLSFYPNPSAGFITFNEQIEINSIYRIFDLQGKLLLSGYTQENTPVSIENLSSGKYILLIQHNQQFKAELLLKN